MTACYRAHSSHLLNFTSMRKESLARTHGPTFMKNGMLIALLIVAPQFLSPINCMAQTAKGSEVLKAVELLREAVRCPLEPCDTHCGISSGTSERKLAGDGRTFDIISTERSIKAIVTRTDSGKYGDFDPARTTVKGELVTLVCKAGSSCVHSTQVVKCGSDYDCLESTQRGGENAERVTFRSPKLELYFCDKKTAGGAKIAYKILLQQK